MKISSSFSVKKLIRKARGSQTQAQFGKQMGIPQNALSKYESGRIPNPPASLIEKCMAIVDVQEKRTALDAKTVARKVQATLNGPEHAEIRLALAALLDYVAAQSSAKRRPGSAQSSR